MKIEKLPTLDGEALSVLHSAMCGYDEFFKGEIRNGISELWRINDGDMYSITRVERDILSDQIILVVCCIAGFNMRNYCRHVMQVCQARGWEIRVHTFFPTIAKLLQRNYGFDDPQFVLTRKVK